MTRHPLWGGRHQGSDAFLLARLRRAREIESMTRTYCDLDRRVNVLAFITVKLNGITLADCFGDQREHDEVLKLYEQAEAARVAAYEALERAADEFESMGLEPPDAYCGGISDEDEAAMALLAFPGWGEWLRPVRVNDSWTVRLR